MTNLQSPLKWTGSKRKLVDDLLKHVPAEYGAYHEPFVGGGSLFFALQPKRSYLSDANGRLVKMYQAIRDYVEDVIDDLLLFQNDKAFFEQMRQTDIDQCNPVETAAWMICLNKTCYNGLYRVNKKGKFNVPFGKYANPTICNADLLRECAKALRTASLNREDFAFSLRDGHVAEGDLVYSDPPYIPLNATSNFTSYTADGFDDTAQVRLRDRLWALKQRGVHVLISGSSADRTRELYKEFECVELTTRRTISAKASSRGECKELLFK